MKESHDTCKKISIFVDMIRSKEDAGISRKLLENYEHIGIGGSQLWSEFVFEEIQANAKAEKFAKGRMLRFLINVDTVIFPFAKEI